MKVYSYTRHDKISNDLLWAQFGHWEGRQSQPAIWRARSELGGHVYKLECAFKIGVVHFPWKPVYFLSTLHSYNWRVCLKFLLCLFLRTTKSFPKFPTLLQTSKFVTKLLQQASRPKFHCSSHSQFIFMMFHLFWSHINFKTLVT